MEQIKVGQLVKVNSSKYEPLPLRGLKGFVKKTDRDYLVVALVTHNGRPHLGEYTLHKNSVTVCKRGTVS